MAMSPELTPEQRRRCNTLIKRLCANYDNGNCIALDEGDGCVCVQSISYHIYCKYFRNAVLPTEPILEADIFGNSKGSVCGDCGIPIEKTGNKKKYCSACARKRHLKSKAEYQRKYRMSVDK